MANRCVVKPPEFSFPGPLAGKRGWEVCVVSVESDTIGAKIEAVQ